MIKCLLTELGRAGRENIWPSVMAHGPRCARSVRHDLGPNIFPSGPPTQSISTNHFAQLCYILMQKYGILTLTNEKLKHADFASECQKSRFRGLKIPKFPQGSTTGTLPLAAPLIRPHFVKIWIRPRKRVFIRTRDNRPYYSCVLSYLAYE